jgi:hypothetical protein
MCARAAQGGRLAVGPALSGLMPGPTGPLWSDRPQNVWLMRAKKRPSPLARSAIAVEIVRTGEFSAAKRAGYFFRGSSAALT